MSLAILGSYMYALLADIQASDINLPKVGWGAFPRVLTVVFQIAALLSIIFVAFGGLKYATSNGDPQGIKKAKDTILYAVIGLVISLSAAAITSFVGAQIG